MKCFDKKYTPSILQLALGLSLFEGELQEFNEEEALKELEPLVRGKELLEKKLVS